ncbi:hypothetical protein B0H17DRAFT_1142983 [Mycena rosella]|uniref:Uncharacterized protein n=1 Tax=Mycena rosella TaxID=1033263 RepID=A0AAD7CWN3_MYCRO|nr:hypothetical protein B0H17DRAFT_1142983 [Mycena rosella]
MHWRSAKTAQNDPWTAIRCLRLAGLKPRLHVFGHIHEARGAYLHSRRPDSPALSAQNASQLEDVKETFWTRSKPRVKNDLSKFKMLAQDFLFAIFVVGWDSGRTESKVWGNVATVEQFELSRSATLSSESAERMYWKPFQSGTALDTALTVTTAGARHSYGMFKLAQTRSFDAFGVKIEGSLKL